LWNLDRVNLLTSDIVNIVTRFIRFVNFILKKFDGFLTRKAISACWIFSRNHSEGDEGLGKKLEKAIMKRLCEVEALRITLKFSGQADLEFHKNDRILTK